MPDQESFSPLPLEGADERSEAGLAFPHVKKPLGEPTSAPSGHLLPKEGGSVPPSRIVISSESEKSFSFAVKKGCEERDHGKHRTPNDFIPLREPTSAPSGHLLPKEGGSVSLSRIVISSESEKSFSFAVKKGCEERDHGKHRTPNDFIPLREPTSATFGAPPSPYFSRFPSSK